jgi:hypothetical protein
MYPKKSSQEPYFSKNGVYIGGFLHAWGFLSSKLEDAAFEEKEMQIIMNCFYPTNTIVYTQEIQKQVLIN